MLAGLSEAYGTRAVVLFLNRVGRRPSRKTGSSTLSARRRGPYSNWHGVDLAVEVVSADDPERDTTVKRKDDAAAGIPEYWIVNPLTDTITVLVLAGDTYVEHGGFSQRAMLDLNSERESVSRKQVCRLASQRGDGIRYDTTEVVTKYLDSRPAQLILLHEDKARAPV